MDICYGMDIFNRLKSNIVFWNLGVALSVFFFLNLFCVSLFPSLLEGHHDKAFMHICIEKSLRQ